MPRAHRLVTAPGRTVAEVEARLGIRFGVPGGEVFRGVSQDSRTVRPGDLYLALPGSRWHGVTFLAQAAARGALAALVDPAGAGPVPCHLPWAHRSDLRARAGPLASWIYGEPSRAMDLIGVTGTNGKTSTTHLLRAGMDAAGRRTGLLSGVELAGPGWSRPATRSTAEAADLQRIFAELVEAGVETAALEVSSHGLALRRIDGTILRAGVFTNLGRDHLDLHGDMDTYFATKARLFDPVRCGLAVVSVDDEWGRRLAHETPLPTVTFSAAGRPADWTAHDVTATGRATSFRLSGPGGADEHVRLSVLGRHQVDNALGAVAALVSTGTDRAAAVRGISSVAAVPGRLERVDVGQACTAFVDYVHNPSGQARVYPYLRSLTGGRLVVVMGATGERDPGKRVPLGQAAGAVADLVVVTDESPYGEDPRIIRDAVAAGVRLGARADLVVEPDRARAIELAVTGAREGDVVVVCGRGHDPVRVDAAGRHTFDDRAELRAALLRERL